MKDNTRNNILKIAKQLFASNGYEGFSMRTLAKESGVGLSSIYHFFIDKDEILKTIFDETNINLGIKRSKLEKNISASEMLRDRIKFQFDNIEDIVFVLKYYMHFRPNFLKLEKGFLPPKAYLHIEEVLKVGIENNAFAIQSKDLEEQSKVIAHSINGFLLEYYPDTSNESEIVEVTDSIHRFLMRSLTNKEVIM